MLHRVFLSLNVETVLSGGSRRRAAGNGWKREGNMISDESVKFIFYVDRR